MNAQIRRHQSVMILENVFLAMKLTIHVQKAPKPINPKFVKLMENALKSVKKDSPIDSIDCSSFRHSKPATTKTHTPHNSTIFKAKIAIDH